eukprot:GEMP01015727.1.p1 GENE.GEMP01015727.1~~GEMP01015727.1.p1  ORF type:complete len:546 (+),score=68.48 GEMP01015727.1:135-1772(+)
MNSCSESDLLVEILVAAISLCIGGLVSYAVYVRHRQTCSFQLLKGSFPNVINFSLTFFDEDVMHIRTLFETDLLTLTRNNSILVDIVERSRLECRQDAAILREPRPHRCSLLTRLFGGTIPWASATQHLHMLIYNELIARYSSHGEIARIAGATTKEVPFYFSVTCEQGVDLNGTKIRVVLISRSQLLAETGEERGSLPTVTLPGQMIRYRSLCEMKKRVLEEADMLSRGDKIVRQVWQLLLSVEVQQPFPDDLPASEQSEEWDLADLSRVRSVTHFDDGESRSNSKESSIPAIILPQASAAKSVSITALPTKASFLSEYDELSMPTPAARRSTQNFRGRSVRFSRHSNIQHRSTEESTASNSRRTIAPKPIISVPDEASNLKAPQGDGHRISSRGDINQRPEGRHSSRKSSRESFISNNVAVGVGETTVLPSFVDTDDPLSPGLRTSRDHYLPAVCSTASHIPSTTGRSALDSGPFELDNSHIANNAHDTGGTLERGASVEYHERLHTLEERVDKIAVKFEDAQAETLAKLVEVLTELKKHKSE